MTSGFAKVSKPRCPLYLALIDTLIGAVRASSAVKMLKPLSTINKPRAVPCLLFIGTYDEME